MLNISVLEEIISSKEMITKTKELYDGDYKAKIIKGMKEDAADEDITDLVTNFIGVSSLDALDRSGREELHRVAKSGLYRRAIIVDSIQKPESNDIEEANTDEIVKTFEELDEKKKESYLNRVEDLGRTGTTKETIPYNTDVLEHIEKLDKILIKRADDDPFNVFKAFDTGSLNLIVNTAYIIAFIEDCDMVTVEHLDKAHEFFLETRETVERTFIDVQPHNEVYEILGKKGNLTHSELIELSKCECIPKTKRAFEDTILLVKELAYRAGKELKIGSGIVTRYSVEELEDTNLKKLILSISTDDRGAKSIAYEEAMIDWNDIERLVKSEKVDSFTTCHYNATKTTEPYGHRKASEFIEGQNLIVFDIDNGMTISEAKRLLERFTYCIYSTKSHNSEKSEYGDRFRIIMPTKNKFYVTAEQHKELIENVEIMINLTSNDTQTRNVSRLFYTNSKAEVVLINDGELIDVSGCMPDTDKSDKFLPEMIKMTEDMSDDELDEVTRRITGLMKYSMSIVHVGNLKGTLFNFAMFVKDIGADYEMWTYRLAASIKCPDRFPAKVIESVKNRK